jgi:hypothetical protein
MLRFVPGSHSASYIQGEALEYDDIHLSVVMNWVEYKKHKKLQSISSETRFNIRLLVLTSYIS